MKTSAAYLLIGGLLGVLGVGLLPRVFGQGPTGSQTPTPGATTGRDRGKARDADLEAIRKTARGFADAFERGDPAAAAGYLSAGAELVPNDAPPLRGREAIQRAFAEYFANKPPRKVKGEVESTRFISRDVAIEEGKLSVATGTEAPDVNRTSILYVREDGKWLIGAIREWPSEMVELEDLEWLIGNWHANRTDADVSTTYEWFGDKAFIRGMITVRQKDVTLTAMQLIGVDPETGELKVWIFESDGGVAEGSCTRDGNAWTFTTSGKTADGGALAATNILVHVNHDTMTWQPVNLVVNDEQVTGLPPVKVTRVKSK